MNRRRVVQAALYILPTWLALNTASLSAQEIPRYALVDIVFEATGEYSNPYLDVEAEAVVHRPDGAVRRIPLFWDGDRRWRLRVSPHQVGRWMYEIKSPDSGLNTQAGSFVCVASERRGSIEPMKGATFHFQYQNGEPMWFLGDTAWALFTDSSDEQHDRTAAQQYLQARAQQGFNVVHAMLLSEAGWGNAGGLPFLDMQAQKINPGYWREVDRRVAFANQQGLVVGVVLAWGDKRQVEPFAWRRFPDLAARKRYARYIAARYSAYDTYFIVSGEWHAEVRARGSTEKVVRREFTQIGSALAAADPHNRMIAIHPMTRHGSVREFNEAAWMSFGDYQQNYANLHERVLQSRAFNKPVVNSEYGYHLRDRDGDGQPDKDNSTSLESIRHASWDIVMAGGYLVTGFGTTYFGGNRDPGPFDIDAAKNKPWERQIGVIKQVFTDCQWWGLEPSDGQVSCATPRDKDGRELGRLAPPATTYWMLADPGTCYLVYARGLRDQLSIQLGPDHGSQYEAELVNLRTGRRTPASLDEPARDGVVKWTPPDRRDWVLRLSKSESATIGGASGVR